MSSAAQYDVVIVGAGIAGCAAAALYGRRGARVALIERHADPAAYKTVCTTFIQASATPVLERLGMVPRLEKAGAIRNAIDIWTRWGWIRPRRRHGPSPVRLWLTSDRPAALPLTAGARAGGLGQPAPSTCARRRA